MHISVTRLHLRSLLFLYPFVRGTEAAIGQLRASAGFVSGRLLVDRWFTFWTVSAWDSAEAMRAFRDSGAHREIMPKLLDWCDEASVAAWTGEGLPDWSEVHTRMAQAGRPSRLKTSSRRHREAIIAPIRPTFPARPIAPFAGAAPAQA